MSKKFVIIIVGAIFVIIIIGFVFYLFWPQLPESIKFFHPFRNCQVIAESCLDKDCRYLFLCNGNEFTNCTVYDCGDKYGVLIKNEQGEISERIIAKPDKTKVAEIIERCRGSFEVLEKKECEGGQTKAKVKFTKLSTEGDCQIESFIIKIDNENRIAKFKEEDGFYWLSLDRCGKITDIIAIGEGGKPIITIIEDVSGF